MFIYASTNYAWIIYKVSYQHEIQLHKLHFQPKSPASAKAEAINNKNGFGMAEV